MIAGLYDTEVKEDILSAEDKPLDETVKAIEAKESGKLARKTVGVSEIPPTIVEQGAPQPPSPSLASPHTSPPQSPVVPSTPESPSFVTPPSSPMGSEQIPLRRSTRTRVPPKRYSPDEYLLSQVGGKRMIQMR